MIYLPGHKAVYTTHWNSTRQIACNLRTKDCHKPWSPAFDMTCVNPDTIKLYVDVGLFNNKWVCCFYIRCVMLKLYEWNWCVISDTSRVTYKNSQKFIYRIWKNRTNSSASLRTRVQVPYKLKTWFLISHL